MTQSCSLIATFVFVRVGHNIYISVVEKYGEKVFFKYIPLFIKLKAYFFTSYVA